MSHAALLVVLSATSGLFSPARPQATTCASGTCPNTVSYSSAYAAPAARPMVQVQPMMAAAPAPVYAQAPAPVYASAPAPVAYAAAPAPVSMVAPAGYTYVTPTQPMAAQAPAPAYTYTYGSAYAAPAATRSTCPTGTCPRR
jgi:hypothetical protein